MGRDEARIALRFAPSENDCFAVYLIIRRGGLMVSALVPGSSGPGSRGDRGHCVVFLGKTLNSHSASLHPGVEMGGSDLRWTSIPSRGSRNTPSHATETGISSGSYESVLAPRLHF